MRAAILRDAGHLEIEELPEPELLAGSVVVDVDRCGVSRSDVDSFISGTVAAPAWFGHEWVGRVRAIGAGVEDRLVGDRFVGERFVGERVVGSAPAPCGICRPCGAGLAEHCTLVLEMIVGTDPLASDHGAFAERLRVDARRVHRVPEGIDDDDAALAEPAAVATHAVARARLVVGDLVVVVGAGTVGLLVAELARLSGASAVVAIDPDPLRRELVCDLGAVAAFSSGEEAEAWLRQRSHGLGADFSFDCAASPSGFKAAVASIRRGGTVVSVGVGPRPQTTMTAALLEREGTLLASAGYTVSDMRRALDLMADDRLRLTGVSEAEPISLGALAGHFGAIVSSGGRGGRKTLVQPTL